MKISAAGTDLIRKFEGCRLKAYLDAVGVPTIGFGHTVDVKLGQVITQHQADTILASDLEIYEDGVNELFKGVTLTQGQFDALVSFSFNLGVTRLAASTLRKKMQRGDVQGAADEFLKWSRAGGNVLAGLVKRRAAERAMFLGLP